MKPRLHPYKPVTTANDCRDWLTPDDVIRHALAAFYALCRHQEQNEAEFGAGAFLGDNDREAFATDLAEIFAHKLHEQGFKQNVPGFHGWASETLAWWLPDTPTSAPEVTGLDIHRRAFRSN